MFHMIVACSLALAGDGDVQLAHATSVSPRDNSDFVNLPASDLPRSNGRWRPPQDFGVVRADNKSNSKEFQVSRTPSIDPNVRPVSETILALEKAATSGDPEDLVLIGPPSRFAPRVRGEYLTEGAGMLDAFAFVGAAVPIHAVNGDVRKLRFIEGGMLVSHDSNLGASVDLVSRSYRLGQSSLYWNAYVGYDFRETENRSYQQIAFGWDQLGESSEARLNGYVPISDRGSLGSSPSTVTVGSFVLPAVANAYEAALYGLDGEVGWQVLNFGRSGIWWLLGGYHFWGHSSPSATGFKTRAEFRLRDWGRAAVEFQTDDVFGSNFVFGGEVIFPGTRPRNATSDFYVSDRLGEPVRRWRTHFINRWTETTVP